MPRRSNVDKAAKQQHAVKRKAGRPQHVPDDRNRRRVTAWAGGGIDQKLIAAMLGISDPTLRRHYRAELNIGKTIMSGLAVETLMRAMQAGGRESVTAAIFWTKMRMGWGEMLTVDDGRANQPLRVIVELVDDPAPVSIESIERRPMQGAFDAGRFAA